MEYFIAHNGIAMIEGDGCDFSKNFDWVIVQNRIIKKNYVPKSIYLKTESLGYFCSHVLPKIFNPFVLISGCSDFSPQINFSREFEIIYNNNFLKIWYMENMAFKYEKIRSLPVGLATHSLESEKFLLDLREATKETSRKERIFSCSRCRTHNDLGPQFNVRSKYLEYASNHLKIFDIHTPDKTLEEYLKILSTYKYALCPHGNGTDPNPCAWNCLALNVIPIIHETDNTKCMFQDISECVIFVKNPEEIPNSISEKKFAPIEFLTASYWADKILKNIIKF